MRRKKKKKGRKYLAEGPKRQSGSCCAKFGFMVPEGEGGLYGGRGAVHVARGRSEARIGAGSRGSPSQDRPEAPRRRRAKPPTAGKKSRENPAKKYDVINGIREEVHLS